MKVQFYRDRKREYRWRLVSRNNRVMADSGEGDVRRGAAINAWRRVAEEIVDGHFDVEVLA